MLSLILHLDSTDKKVYEKLQQLAEEFVESVRSDEPNLLAESETWFNPNLHKLPTKNKKEIDR
jgi:hypothetical protein